MSDIELKPCPFCGSEDAEMQQCQAEHYVQCLECEGASALFSSRREARELWNRRAAIKLPDGYVLVPAEPNHAMRKWLWKAPYSNDTDYAWSKLLAARPEVK